MKIPNQTKQNKKNPNNPKKTNMAAASKTGWSYRQNLPRLDRALSSLVQWKVSLPMAGGLQLGDL